VRPSDPNRFARSLFAGLPARYDRLAEVLSFGQNGRWRRAAVGAATVGNPDRVADIATGTAGVALLLAARSTAHVAGVDLTEPMLRQGAANVARAGRRGRVALLAGRAEQLPFADATFDALVFTYLLRYVTDPAATLEELARVVRPGGRMSSLEFGVPPVWPLRGLWWLYTRAVLPAAGYVTGGREWFRVGRFLGPSISEHYRRYPVNWTVAAWEKAGMVDVSVRRMSLGGGLVMWGQKAGD
jgi:demethylmenaquinone methyltransferase/2-methoxy-6-polyprenyl-1,4-benzoquinol methylase